MKFLENKSELIAILVIIGGGALLMISFGIRHSFGLYLVPISSYLNTGREVFSFAVALQVLLIGVGSPLFGAFSDKYGSGKASLLGVSFAILGLYLMANTNQTFDIILSHCQLLFYYIIFFKIK